MGEYKVSDGDFVACRRDGDVPIASNLCPPPPPYTLFALTSFPLTLDPYPVDPHVQYLMGEYDLSRGGEEWRDNMPLVTLAAVELTLGSMHNIPLYVKDGEHFIFKSSSSGRWMATNDVRHIAKDEGYLVSSDAADLPSDPSLRWGFGGFFQIDRYLKCTEVGGWVERAVRSVVQIRISLNVMTSAHCLLGNS